MMKLHDRIVIEHAANKRFPEKYPSKKTVVYVGIALVLAVISAGILLAENITTDPTEAFVGTGIIAIMMAFIAFHFYLNVLRHHQQKKTFCTNMESYIYHYRNRDTGESEQEVEDHLYNVLYVYAWTADVFEGALKKVVGEYYREAQEKELSGQKVKST